MSLGQKIKKLRLDKGLSQLEVANEVGVARSAIAQYERGTKIPNLLTGKAIAEVLGCSLDELAEGA